MQRDYPHRPDIKALQRRLDGAPEAFARAEATVLEGRAHLGIVHSAVEHCWRAAGTRWLFGAAPAEVWEFVPRAATVIQAGLDGFPGPMLAANAVSWLGLVAVAGQPDRLRGVAGRVLAVDGIASAPPTRPQEVAAAQLLAALAIEDEVRTRTLLDELDRLGERDLPSPLVEADSGLYRMVAAVLAGDQAGLDAATRDRSAGLLGFAARSQTWRANAFVLLDQAGLLVMSVAQRRGLVPTPDVPDLPVELLPGRS